MPHAGCASVEVTYSYGSLSEPRTDPRHRATAGHAYLVSLDCGNIIIHQAILLPDSANQTRGLSGKKLY